MAYIKKESLCAWLENMGVSDYIINTIKDDEHFPTADVEEVVRCGECKTISCLLRPFAGFDGKSYCSLGERRDA